MALQETCPTFLQMLSPGTGFTWKTVIEMEMWRWCDRVQVLLVSFREHIASVTWLVPAV